MILKIDTPCIGICSTVYGDKICRGCKRQYQEVIDWNAYTTEQKAVVYERLDAQMQEIVGKYLQVENAQLLESILKRYSIRYRDDQHPLSWALFALRFADTKIASLSEAGILVYPEYAHLSMKDLCNLVDIHLYEYCVDSLL